MALTATTVQERVLEYLYGGNQTERPYERILDQLVGLTAMDAGTTVWPQATADAYDDFAVGDVLEMPSGEQVFIRTQSASSITVIRGYNGTTDADPGTSEQFFLVKKNARFTLKQVDTAVASTIFSFMGLGLHDVSEATEARAAATDIHALAVADARALSAYYLGDSPEYHKRYLPFNPQQVNTGIPEIQILEWHDVKDTEAFYIRYTHPYLLVTDLPTELEEIVVIGAVSLLLGRTLAPRTMDPGARTDRTVQPGQSVRDGRWFQFEFITRVRAEVARQAVEEMRHLQGASTRYTRAQRWRA